jgi:ABC-type multidrug transport system fused ATPase/permease subunit
MPHKRRDMVWILIGVTASYVFVNSPLIYSLLYGHRARGIGNLWGYAPNQFFFLVVVYPFAAFASLAALRSFVVRLYSSLPPDSKLTPVFDHWPVAVLVGLIIAALFTILVYFTSSWSFDKLRPEYAQQALKATEDFENKIARSSNNRIEQDANRKQLIRLARQNLSIEELPKVRNEEVVRRWLDRLLPEEYLQVVQDRSLTSRLRLLDPTIHALNIFQTLLVLFVGSVVLFVAAACIAYGYEAGYDGRNLPHLKATLDCVFWAVFFFSFYVICYHQFRSQMEELVGTRTTILQDVIAALLVAAVFVGIKLIDPTNREFGALTILKLWPIAFFASGIAAEEKLPQLMRQLIGNETTLGFQVALSFVFFLLALIPTIVIIIRQ